MDSWRFFWRARRSYFSTFAGAKKSSGFKGNDLPLLLLLAQLAVDHFAALDDGSVVEQAADLEEPIQIDGVLGVVALVLRRARSTK